jgi:hypothetical protein
MQEQFAAACGRLDNRHALGFNGAHDRVRVPLLVLVLWLSEATGGGRVAIGLTN